MSPRIDLAFTHIYIERAFNVKGIPPPTASRRSMLPSDHPSSSLAPATPIRVDAETGLARDVAPWLAESLATCHADLAVLLAPTDGGAFEVVACAGTPPLPSVGERIAGGDGSLCGYASLHSGAIIFDNIVATARFRGSHMATEFGAVSSLVVAVRRERTVLGVLSIHARSQHGFTAREARSLERTAEGIAARLAS
jgi:GAF domain-containing protein